MSDNCNRVPATQRFSSIEAAKIGYRCRGSEIPVISRVNLPSESVGRFDLYEIDFLLSAVYDNPFDPDDICVDGVFTRPDGKVATVPAFFYEPIEKTNGKILLVYSPAAFTVTGCGGWKIRFAADTVGEYSFTIRARDAKGQTCESEVYRFTVTESQNKGFVTISKNNPGRFENSADHSAFWGTGTNIAWVRPAFTKNPEHLSYNYFLDRAEDMSNCTRVWICHWAWLEWMPQEGDPSTYAYCGMSYYNQCVCSAFDDIVRMCEEKGLRIIVCLDDNDEHYPPRSYGNWGFNPYNAKNGGPVDDVRNYFTTKEVLPYYKKRLRYIVARWGYSSAVLSLNLWNDMSSPSPGVEEYLDELCRYTHSLTENYRTLLFGSNFKMQANAVLDYTTQSPTTFDGTKPNVTNECWSSPNRLWFRDSLETTLWSELSRGFATTMIWDHDYVDEHECWDLFRRILDFSADIPFNNSHTNSSETHVISAEMPECNITPAKVITVRDYGDVKSWGQKATQNVFHIDSSRSSVLLEGYTPNLYSGNTERWKNPPTFIIDTPQGGKLLLDFDEIGGGEQKLELTLNGKLVKTVEWSGGRRMLTADERYVEVDLPVGRNEVRLDNTGTDWLRIQRVYFVVNAGSADSMITAQQLSGKDFCLVYVQNQTYFELYRTVLNGEPADIKNVTVTAAGMNDGDYVLSLYDPTDNAYLLTENVTVTGGKHSITVPLLKKHMAIKLVRKELAASGPSEFIKPQLKSK